MSISIAENCDNMVFMANFPNNFFDIAIVDPQTGQDEGNKHASRPKEVKQKNGNYLKHNGVHVKSDWDKEPPKQSYYDELFRVSKHQIIMCENYLHFDQKKDSAGRIIWNLLRDNDFSACQIMWTDLFQKIDYFEFLWNGMIQGYQINNRQQQGNKKLNEKRINSTQKPKPVYHKLMKDYCEPGFKILDTHLGSGNSRIVAKELGFDFWGCELEKEMFDKSCEAFDRYHTNLFSLKQ